MYTGNQVCPISEGQVVNLACESAIDLCQGTRVIFACIVEGTAVEWSFYEHNLPDQSTVIRLDESQAIGVKKRQGLGTAFITNRGHGGTRSALLIEVNSTVAFKEINIACNDLSIPFGHKRICPPTVIIPSKFLTCTIPVINNSTC